MKTSLIRQPSAWLPIAMSLAALAVILGHIALFGAAREADEGTAAHLFQILMAAQIPAVGYFGLKWLPQSPKDALPVLGLQLAIAFVPLAVVFGLGL